MSVINDLYRVLFGRSGTERGTDIDMSEHGRAGGISTGQPYKFVGDVNEAIKITESGATTYIAFAAPGTSQSSANWKAMKLDDSDGLLITYADGNAEFDNVASNLASLSYS